MHAQNQYVQHSKPISRIYQTNQFRNLSRLAARERQSSVEICTILFFTRVLNEQLERISCEFNVLVIYSAEKIPREKSQVKIHSSIMANLVSLRTGICCHIVSPITIYLPQLWTIVIDVKHGRNLCRRGQKMFNSPSRQSPIANVKQTRNILPQMLAAVFYFFLFLMRCSAANFQPSDRMKCVHDIVLAYADTTSWHKSETWNKWNGPFSAPIAERKNVSDVFCVNGFESKNWSEIECRKTRIKVDDFETEFGACAVRTSIAASRQPAA